MSRYDINRSVKIVLVRNAADLTRLDYSCSPTTVHIWGDLVKDPEGEFSVSNVEALMKELSRLPDVRRLQVDLENWDVQKGEGAWIVTGKKKGKAAKADRISGKTVSSSGEQKTLVIKEQEKISEVLKDIPGKKKETP